MTVNTEPNFNRCDTSLVIVDHVGGCLLKIHIVLKSLTQLLTLDDRDTKWAGFAHNIILFIIKSYNDLCTHCVVDFSDLPQNYRPKY